MGLKIIMFLSYLFSSKSLRVRNVGVGENGVWSIKTLHNGVQESVSNGEIFTGRCQF